VFWFLNWFKSYNLGLGVFLCLSERVPAFGHTFYGVWVITHTFFYIS